ncbi:hypothetical protein GWI33_000657 [Rhynchophorus ferrugineus]|uniref:Uncharacterized protein n=1 Tax=Rhynchophorus ferrugineus TaxID=354439 RepID=A0A834HLW7_RHYFE|nr:hypothetical protein GWI33_000657 [Rhynchophorus ferrugineus]
MVFYPHHATNGTIHCHPGHVGVPFSNVAVERDRRRDPDAGRELWLKSIRMRFQQGGRSQLGFSIFSVDVQSKLQGSLGRINITFSECQIMTN